MYHGAGYRKLGRKTPHRMAMFANMASSLIEHERISTTLPKAKELRRIVERLVTRGKSGTLPQRRAAFAFLRNDAAVEKLFGQLAPRFKDRSGGYIRILKTSQTRLGDAAPVALIEFVDYVLPKAKTKDEKKKESADKRAKEKEEKKARAASPKSLKGEKAPAKKAQKKAGGSASMKSSGSRGT
ncbi:MAG: 50S ribosomal protein L17 [Bdellovibrionales bacterium]|nr:50S ribosomal protein L17 [Bdellovibrionales bacterium]